MRHVAEVFGDDQVDEVVDVGQPAARELLDGHFAVQPKRPDVLAGRVDVARVRVEALDEVAVAGPQGGRQLPSPQPTWTTSPPATPVSSMIRWARFAALP